MRSHRVVDLLPHTSIYAGEGRGAAGGRKGEKRPAVSREGQILWALVVIRKIESRLPEEKARSKMMGDFLSRILLLALGYAYPAYECYKTVELNKPEIEKLIFWCQYWILVALLTVFERFGDFAISWLPLYSEAKLMFFIYLWCPRTKGTTYVYETFFRPYISQYENDIDCSILDLRARAGDMLVVYWQKVAIIGQSTFFNILKYASTQSPVHSSRSRPSQ
ncbi:hypothetical protein E2562_022795, partial [Oryza meyeriana var. granulata]